MQLESSLIIHLCCVSVWYDKSISIILHTDRTFFFFYFVYCIYVAWLSVSYSHKRVR